ncbi:MAG: GNAT family N-acetyltransferase [Phycisphaerae bacterium]|nr:GNAT family N-acetyltransferase [Phycisphaerae bacterium]
MQLTFRTHVEPPDREHVRRMVSSSGFFRPDEVPVAVELVTETLEKEDASGYSFIFAEADGEPVGYACFGLIPCTLTSYDLYWIVVDDACRGRGIGIELMRRVEASVAKQGGKRIYIETSTRDLYTPTRRFYEKCGYEIVATLPDFYADNDGKHIFHRSLGRIHPA